MKNNKKIISELLWGILLFVIIFFNLNLIQDCLLVIILIIVTEIINPSK